MQERRGVGDGGESNCAGMLVQARAPLFSYSDMCTT